ncbi:MAG: phosphoglycerate dehydrogenase [Gammaproteobacteria bacterium]
MNSILVTCPPMLGMLERFVPEFEKAGYTVDAPDVVQTLSEAELVERLPHHRGWIIGDDPATRAVFEAGVKGELKAAVKWGVGVDNVDFEAARRLNLPITNTPNMFGHEVADVAHGYVIGLARELFLIDRGVRAQEWPKPRGISLAGKKAGLIGFGDIGAQTARRLEASGLSLVVYDPALDQAPNPTCQLARWPDQIEQCDFLVFTCALTASSRHMLNAETLARCKPGVRIVNVARGPLIDESALVDALESGQVHSVALDVMEFEPLPAASPMRDMPRCIFGSHNGSNTVEAVIATSEQAMRALFGFLA